MLSGFNERIPYNDFKIVRDVIEMIFSTKVGPRFRIWRYRYNASCRVGYTHSSPNCCNFSTLMITWRLSIVHVPCSTVAWGVKQSIIDLIDCGRGVWCDGQLVGGARAGATLRGRAGDAAERNKISGTSDVTEAPIKPINCIAGSGASWG